MYMPAKVVAKGDSIHFFGYLTNQTKVTQNADILQERNTEKPLSKSSLKSSIL